jgi:hypothetical protein
VKRWAVIAVQVVAAVLVGLAIRELWLAVNGGGDSVAEPRSAVSVTTDVAPNVVAFGTPVVATADVVADARIVRPESITMQVDFSPYELAGEPTVERHVTGSSAHVRFRYPLRCLREGCEPAAARGVAEFRSGLVRYRFRDSPGAGRDFVDWPAVVVASRVATDDVEAIRWRASETQLPAVTTRFGAKGLAAVLLLAALALLAGAVWLGRRLWHVPAVPENLDQRPVRPPLERALELARAELGNGVGPAERRRALERVARELEVLGYEALADDARALAWSPHVSTGEDVESFARRVEDAVSPEVAA